LKDYLADMPANKKYLTKSPLHKTLKITAGIIGGWFLSFAFHQCLMLIFPKTDVYVSMHFMAYMVWVTLMIVAFLAKSGWRIWGWYILFGVILFSPYLYKML
jgi:uncharacterized membrane protein YgdD (TMEM256/DUF423 family)